MAANFPHITISIARNSKESHAAGDLNSLSVGFGVFQAWLYLAVFGTSAVFPQGGLIEGFPYLPENLVTVVFDAFLVTSALCLLFLAFSNQVFLKFYVRKGALTLATVLASAGTYLIYATCLGGFVGSAVAVVAGCAMGMGSSLMIVLWGTAFSRYEFTTIILNAVIAIVVGLAAYLILIHWTITPFSGMLTGLLPIVASLLLWKLTPMPYYRRQEMPIFHPLPIHRTQFALRFGLPVFIFGFSLGALRHICVSGLLPVDDISSQLVIGAAACASVGIAIATIALSRDDVHWDMTSRFLVPFAAVAITCLPLVGGENTLLASFFIVFGYICFETLVWFLFADLAQEFRLSPIFVFGLGRGLLELGSMVGSVPMQLPAGDPPQAFSNPEGALIMLFTLIVAYALLPRQHEIRAIVDPNHIIRTPGYDALQAEVNTTVSQQEAAAEVAAPTEAVAEVDERTRAKGRFHARCEQIADRYLLSRRETEVMFLLAKGHNAAFIQDKLCISKSTAKTHINHIYRKLDIHTQQELLNMVEGIALPPSQPEEATEGE